MVIYQLIRAIVFGLLPVVTLFAADRYEVDPVHTNIGFSVRHMVVSNVQGEFKDFDAVFLYDEKNPENSSIEATIKVTSLDTDNEKRDNHLKSDAFFYAEKYPEIRFVSNHIRKTGNDEYLAQGTLTIRGVSKQVDLPFKILGMVKDNYGNTRLGAEAELVINRHDFGVSWNKTLEAGGVVVGDEVKINLDVEMIRKD